MTPPLPVSSIAWRGWTWLDVSFARANGSSWSLGFDVEPRPGGGTTFRPQHDLYRGPPRFLAPHPDLDAALAAFWSAGAPRLQPEVAPGDASWVPVPGLRLRRIAWWDGRSCVLEFRGEQILVRVTVDGQGRVVAADPDLAQAGEPGPLAAAVTAFYRVRGEAA